jgi:Domain of unknown function (DUF4369)
MNKLLFAILSITLLTSCNQKKNTLQLTGTIKGLKKGKMYIQKVQDSSLVLIDSIIMNGKSTFETSIKLDEPEMLYLFLDRGVTNSIDNNLMFFAEPGKITIESELDNFLETSKISGSKNNELYEEYKAVISKFNDQNLELLKSQVLNKNRNEILISDLENKQNLNLKRKYLYAANFAVNNAKYEVAPYVALTDISDINMKFLDTIQKSMSDKISKSKYGSKLNEYIAERKKIETK